MKKPNKVVRWTLGLIIHVPSLFFALAYFTRSSSLYPYEGPNAFLIQSYNILLSMLFGAIGVAVIRWKAPWK